MDHKEQIEQAKHAAVKWRTNNPIVGVGELRVDCMVDDLCRSITDLLARAEAAEAANSQLNGTVTTLMESNRKLAEELKAHMLRKKRDGGTGC